MQHAHRLCSEYPGECGSQMVTSAVEPADGSPGISAAWEQSITPFTYTFGAPAGVVGMLPGDRRAPHAGTVKRVRLVRVCVCLNVCD